MRKFMPDPGTVYFYLFDHNCSQNCKTQQSCFTKAYVQLSVTEWNCSGSTQVDVNNLNYSLWLLSFGASS